MLAARTAALARGSSTASRAALNSVRRYATSADARPPVALYGVEGVYTSATYTASIKEGGPSLDAVDKVFTTLRGVFSKNPKLVEIVSSPSLSPQNKANIIAEVTKLGGPEAKGNKVIKGLLDTLAENNRLGLLPGIADKFQILMGAHKGEIQVIVSSATQLDPKTMSRLETAVSKSDYVKSGQKIKMVNKVNTDILGGLVVEIGDRTIDTSVASKIAKLNKLLTDAL